MSSVPTPDPEHPLGADLQFETAVPIAPAGVTPSSGPACVVCKNPVHTPYFHVQGAVVCNDCTQRIQSGQQAPPTLSLARAALYGGAAALAGCTLYALVAIVTGLEIGLIAIVVGVMVGKAIRYASNGMGGRPQQILAVVLTYFAITTSFIPVLVYKMSKDPAAATKSAQTSQTSVEPARPPASAGQAVLMLLLIAAAAPFLELSQGISALISLFIIYIGLKQAWRLTGRTELLVMGPYEVAAPQ